MITDYFYSLSDWVKALIVFWGVIAPPLMLLGILIMRTGSK
jgi:hypothetical protein